MVNIKVAFGGETRRFIASEELSYDELVKKISNLFPTLRESSLDLQLTYRDEDGDIVALSSDEEVVAAISAITTEKTWRLQARQIRPTMTKSNSFLFPLFGTNHLPSSWALHRLLDPFSLNSHHTLLSDGLRLFEKLRVAEEKASAEHKASQQKQAKQETSSNKEEQQKAKPSEKTAQKQSYRCTCSGSHISWRPVVAGSPFFPRNLLGPFGYEIHWSWSPETNEEDETKINSSKQPGANQTQPEPAEERREESTSDQPLEEPQKVEESQSEETTPTTTESVSA